MDIKGDVSTNKLILLFVFDKMEVPLTMNTITDMCCNANDWLTYMDCPTILNKLVAANLIDEDISATNESMYSITYDGRICLASFFTNIPTSLRESISLFVKKNHNKYKRQQECYNDYYMNKDGTFTVNLKIVEPAQPLLEMKLVVASKNIAKDICNRWQDMSQDTYRLLLEHFIK